MKIMTEDLFFLSSHFPLFLCFILMCALRCRWDIFTFILVIMLPQFPSQLVQMCTVSMNSNSLTFLHT